VRSVDARLELSRAEVEPILGNVDPFASPDRRRVAGNSRRESATRVVEGTYEIDLIMERMYK